jgi:polyisoprenyl-teichoic acid--peptidoglycan teichoic acid transferase
MKFFPGGVIILMTSRITLKNNRKRKKRRRIALFFLFFFMLLIGATAVFGTRLYTQFKNSFSDSYEEIESSSKRDEDVKIKKDNFSILIIGVDDSEKREFGENSRSDALLLVTINQEEHSAKLLSIPRDTYVYIPEVGHKTRINHAHSNGGPKVTIETVEELFDIPVDYYVRVNFQAFMEVIDALNGIEVDVPYAITEQDSKDQAGAIQLEPGLQTLNGEEALALARTRKKDNDIERGKRQQEIIKAVIKKAASIQSFSKYDDVIDAIGSNMKTNLTFDEMIYLAQYAVKHSLNPESLVLAGNDSTIHGAYYYQLDEEKLEQTKEILKTHLGLIETETSRENEE